MDSGFLGVDALSNTWIGKEERVARGGPKGQAGVAEARF